MLVCLMLAGNALVISKGVDEEHNFLLNRSIKVRKAKKTHTKNSNSNVD